MGIWEGGGFVCGEKDGKVVGSSSVWNLFFPFLFLFTDIVYREGEFLALSRSFILAKPTVPSSSSIWKRQQNDLDSLSVLLKSEDTHKKEDMAIPFHPAYPTHPTDPNLASLPSLPNHASLPDHRELPNSPNHTNHTIPDRNDAVPPRDISTKTEEEMSPWTRFGLFLIGCSVVLFAHFCLDYLLPVPMLMVIVLAWRLLPDEGGWGHRRR